MNSDELMPWISAELGCCGCAVGVLILGIIAVTVGVTVFVMRMG